MNAPVAIVTATVVVGSVNGTMPKQPAFIRKTWTTWWTVAMVSKRPHAANVAQTSETMSVVGNVLGILKKPMSALGKHDWLTAWANESAVEKAVDCNTDITVLPGSRPGTKAMVMYSCDQFLAGTDPVFGMANVREAWGDTMLGDSHYMGVAIIKNDMCKDICRRGGKFTAVVAYLQ